MPPKKPEVAALIDSILLIEGPEMNLSNGMDKIIIKKINSFYIYNHLNFLFIKKRKELLQL